MADSNVFSKLMTEYGNLEREEAERAERGAKLEKLDAAVEKKSTKMAAKEARGVPRATCPSRL